MVAVPQLLLASGSRHRLRLLRDAGYDPRVVVPHVDERSRPWDPADVEGYVLGLAEAKLESVLPQLPVQQIDPGDRYVVLAADQVVIDPGGHLCHQQRDEDSATAQLLRLAATTHHLVNGIVVADSAGRVERLVDRHRITMAPFDEPRARSYVQRFRPFECAGSYRLEDDAGLVVSVEGDDPTGVIGLPMTKVTAMLERAGVLNPG